MSVKFPNVFLFCSNFQTGKGIVKWQYMDIIELQQQNSIWIEV